MEQPHVTVNGESRSLSGAEPPTTALDWLRGLGLTGAKEGCAEGECGACSVLLARPGVEAPTEWTAVNACLVPAAALAGQEVVTAEGLGDPDALHPVQRELAVRGGSQCGYCTPGFVCSMAAEYYRPGRCASGDFDEHALSGNLCRCTGYRPILEAAEALGAPAAGDHLGFRTTAPPPEPVPVRVPGFVRPDGLAEALELLAEDGAVPIAGSTDLGVEANLRGARPGLLVAIDHLPELRVLNRGTEHVDIGAALSLTEIERRLEGAVPLLDAVFPQFASRLIRNGATIGGNLGTASPIGDLPPALLALDASVVLVSTAGERTVPLVDYFTGYRETVLRPGELIASVRVPLPLAPTAAFHKIAKRRYDDISSVAIAFALEIVDGVVARAAIGLGGVAATPIRATEAERALVGRRWATDVVAEAAAILGRTGTPIDDHRASADYRRAMLETSLDKLFAEAGAA
ncbi:xanthine dehydrogenase small subunit [Nocardioides antri]|uniref:2Fe-2S iron-sulfur cluster binding domain-containing protein n=1 Tax=Nocardioides antri TaxID=2607659 RepID=A0A5B1M2N9_9ACTN|nr:FAD binding domain-containing protein [Nocardioides antri]KAA1426020.1 2Fe-2S iron-sulfur cluster binding domain-containing protein [Nocardioides antri]